MAEAIAARQRESGMSTSQIAEATAIDPGQVSRICRGQFKTASASVMQICTLLNIAGDGLVSEQRAVEDHQRRLERGIIAIWDRTPEDAQRILRLLRRLAEFRGST